MITSVASGISIREMARTTGVSEHTLRYYEREDLMLEVPRHENGHRAYDERHVRWVRLLTRLRAAGMPIARMREYAARMREGDSEASFAGRLQLLRAHRHDVMAKIGELQEHLEVVERKIARYERGLQCLPEGPNERSGEYRERPQPR